MNVTVTVPPPEREESRVLPLALLLALGFHGALAFGLPEHVAASVAALPAPLEVDLAPPPVPARPEPEPRKPSAPPPDARRVSASRPARSLAAAGRLLTALPSLAARAADARLDFVTDPNGAAYGFGVVARGGTGVGEGRSGKGPVTASVVAAPPLAPVSDLAAASDLSEKPQLTAADPCRGYYPASAVVDSASTLVRVVIEADGRVRRAEVLSETPGGQGFGLAAQHCLASQRFTSARNRDGRTVATVTTLRVRFER